MKVIEAPEVQTATGAEALIKEARQRQHRRWLLVISAVVVVLGAAVAVVNGISGSGRTRSHTAPSLLTPASILARAKLGTEGTFSAVYRLSGAASPIANNATVTIAQRASAGTVPSPSRGIGEWSYRLTYRDGSSIEFVVRGGLLEDCTRLRAGKWQCTGPGRFQGFHCTYGCIDVSNGYMFATMLYLPSVAFNLLGLTVEARDSLHPRSKDSRFGPLTCVRVVSDQTLCLLHNGRLYTITGMVREMEFAWTTARLLSEQSTAPLADFTLSGTPKEPYILPLPGLSN
jgi:hypothetical protein